MIPSETFLENKKTSGQSSLELILVLGLVVIPALTMGSAWIKTEWNKSECAFQSFKTARLTLLQTQRKVEVDGIALLPLEDLDRNKEGLRPHELLKEVSQLWEQLSSSSP